MPADDTFALTYMGHVLDVFDTHEDAVTGRAALVRKIKANQLPDFLDADDIDGVEDFGIVKGDYR